MRSFSNLLSTLLALLLLSLTQADNSPKLLLVVQTFRHGARYRFNSTYPFTAEEAKNFGELTGPGQRMHYVFGQTLRQKYANSDIQFPTTYDHTFIYARSTDVNRTIQSAESHLAGMFPLQYGYDVTGVANDYLVPPFVDPLNTNGLDSYSIPQGQQPVPIHVVEEIKDNQLISFNTACSNFQSWSNAIKGDSDWVRIKGEFQGVIDKLIAIPLFNLPKNADLDDVAFLVDTLIAYKWLDNDQARTDNLNKLLEGYSNTQSQMVDPQNKNQLWVQMNLLNTMWLNLYLFKTPQMKRVSITPYLKELLAYFNNALTQKNYFKWIMLSAHDTTIAMVMQGLNLTSWECQEQYLNNTLPNGSRCIYSYPGFASNMIFELYQDQNNKPYIKAQYNGTDIQLCNTNLNYCYLDTFTSIVNNFIVSDYDVECGNVPPPAQKDGSGAQPIWAVVVVIALGILLISTVVYIFIQRKNIAKARKLNNVSDVQSNYSQM